MSMSSVRVTLHWSCRSAISRPNSHSAVDAQTMTSLVHVCVLLTTKIFPPLILRGKSLILVLASAK
jgi:hypothetical protein